MKDYGIVQSAVKPEEKVVDEYSVWVNTDITETAGGWVYHMVQYSKDSKDAGRCGIHRHDDGGGA